MIQHRAMRLLVSIWIYLFFLVYPSHFLLAETYPLPYERASRVHADLKGKWIEISIQEQRLCLRNDKQMTAIYSISSALKGVGQEINSFQTPLGFHRIHQKIGKNQPLFTIFKSQKNTQKIWRPEIADPKQDYVLTRILILDGLETGFNKGKDSLGLTVDSKDRLIYIHGTPDENLIGAPVSHGCIRMKNKDIVELFDLVTEGTTVWIHEGPLFR